MKENTKRIEYRIVNEDDLPPLVISPDGTTGIKVILNEAHTIWLSLHRNTIPAIAQQLQEKLTQFCDSYLTDRLYEREWE